MGLSTSGEAAIYRATEESPNILASPKDDYHVHKAIPLVLLYPELHQPSSYIYNIHFNIILLSTFRKRRGSEAVITI
jgi:hypothetical protein